jgi:protein-S-isoprenylcysteine O-methyltransferase Ste14
MYLAGLVAVWARPLDAPGLAVNLVLTAYFFLGSWHEERRLVAAFGRAYRDYRRRVPWGPGLPF